MGLPPEMVVATGSSLGNQVSIGHVLLQMVVGMAVVVGGIWGFAKLMGRTGRFGGAAGAGSRARTRARRSTPGLAVLSRQPVGKGKSIAVVRAGARCFLVGISDAGLNPLGELDPPEADHGAPPRRGAVTVRSLPAAPAARPGHPARPVPHRQPSPTGVPAAGFAGAGWSPAGGLPGGAGAGSWLESLRQATVRR